MIALVTKQGKTVVSFLINHFSVKRDTGGPFNIEVIYQESHYFLFCAVPPSDFLYPHHVLVTKGVVGGVPPQGLTGRGFAL